MSDTDEKIEIESITCPGKTSRVNKAKYMAMRKAFLPALSSVVVLSTEGHGPNPK